MLCQFFVMILISATSIITCCHMLYIKQLNTMNMKNKTCHTVGRVQTSNNTIKERGRMDIPSKHIHDCSIFWLGIGTSIKQTVLN